MGELCDKSQPRGGEDGQQRDAMEGRARRDEPRGGGLYGMEWSDYHEVVITRPPVCFTRKRSPARSSRLFSRLHSFSSLSLYSTVCAQSPQNLQPSVFFLIFPSLVTHGFRNMGKHPHWLQVYITAFQSSATSAHMRKYLTDDQCKYSKICLLSVLRSSDVAPYILLRV
jgi:hypothetical protein